MTEAEVIDRINSTIKKNGKNAITGEEMNFVLKAIIQLIADSGNVVNWGDIEGTIADQLDLASALNGKVDTVSGKGLSTNDFTNALKTKLDNIEAGAKVNVKADWNATSGDAQILNKPTIPDASDFVAKTDYSPAHSILAQQSGTGSPTSVAIGTNEILGRLSGGGANIKGLSTSEVKGLLDLSGINTGDETEASILSKLGFFVFKQSTPNSTVTGAGEIIIGSVPIGSNRLATIDKLIVDSTFVKTTTLGTYTLKYYLAPNSNNLTGAVEIARAAGFTATTVFIPTFPRNYDVESGNLKGFPFTQSIVIPNATVNPMSTTPFNVANTFHFITTVQFTNTSDSGYLNSQLIKNF